MTSPSPHKRAPSPTTTITRPVTLPVRWAYLALATVCLGLAALGAFLPVLPTTVFVLIAAWATARSSPRLHAWLLNHRLFGPSLKNWHNGQRVSRRSKWTAAFFMAASAAWLIYAVRPWWLAALPILCMATVLVWLWSRPEPE